jgi:hypothetical protein
LGDSGILWEKAIRRRIYAVGFGGLRGMAEPLHIFIENRKVKRILF